MRFNCSYFDTSSDIGKIELMIDHNFKNSSKYFKFAK